MRVYVHFEEEEPCYTAALTAGGPDTTLDDILQDFLRRYIEYYGEGAAELTADAVDIRNSKQKKLQQNGKVSSQLNDKDDIYICRRTDNPSSTKKKSKRKAIIIPHLFAQQNEVPLAAAPSASPYTPTPARPRVPIPAASSMREADKVHAAGEEEDAQASDRSEEEENSDSEWEAAEGARLRALREHMQALAAMAKPAGEKPAANGSKKKNEPNKDEPKADRFTHQLNRKILGGDAGEAAEVVDSSPLPSHQCNVQANCLHCGTHIFYTGASALVACHSCKLVHTCVECPYCGTFFPARPDNHLLLCPVCDAQGGLEAFEEQRSLSFTSQNVPEVERMAEEQEVHVIMQYYRDKNAERQVEVDECIRNNLANPHIRHLHVLTETAMDLTHFSKGKGDKLVQYVQGNWLTYRDVVEYSSRFLRNQTVILCNADIHFDDSLGKLKTLNMQGRCLALTRHDVRAEGLVFQAAAAPISQDAWIFRAPLPAGLADIDFKLGKPGCDNRFAYELRRAGLRVQNPAFAIRVLHLHASEVRNYTHGPDTVKGAYAAVIPVPNLT